MASPTQDRRNEFARSMGFDTYAAYQKDYRSHRDDLQERGFDASVEQLQAITRFGETFDPTNNEMKEPELRAWFDEYVGGDDDEFYAWLQDLYRNA